MKLKQKSSMFPIVKDEGTVRKVIRDIFNLDAYFIEAKGGATFGIPDVLVAAKNQPFMLELKAGEYTIDSEIKFKYDARQYNTILRLRAGGLNVAYLVGVIGTRDYWVVHPVDGLTGKKRFKPAVSNTVNLLSPETAEEDMYQLAKNDWARKRSR